MKTTDSIIIAILGGWYLFEVFLTFFAQKRGQNTSNKKELCVFVVIINSMLLIGAFVGYYSKYHKIHYLYTTNEIVPYIGFLITIIGIAIRSFSIISLNKYFSVNVIIQHDHALIKNGLYKYIRHPCYLGAIIAFFGIGICFANWVSFLCIFFPYTIAIIKRIKYEEKLLEAHFGNEYIDYQKNTNKLIPYIY